MSGQQWPGAVVSPPADQWPGTVVKPAKAKREPSLLQRGVAAAVKTIVPIVAAASPVMGVIAGGAKVRDRASSGDFARDAAKDEGFIDRAPNFVERGTAGVMGGLAETIGALANSDTMRREARALRTGTTQREIAGSTNFKDVKARPSAANIGAFVLEAGLESLPGMATAAIPLAGVPVLAASQTGSLAQQRAANDGREEVGRLDVVKAAPAAIASAALERLGITKLFGAAGANAAVRIGKATVTEAGTEGAQSALEYAGSNLGTDEGVSLDGLVDQVAAGSLAGAGVGGGLRSAIEAPEAIARAIERPAPIAALPPEPLALAEPVPDPSAFSPEAWPGTVVPTPIPPASAPAPAPPVDPQPVASGGLGEVTSLTPPKEPDYASAYKLPRERLEEIAANGPSDKDVDEGVMTREAAAEVLREHQDYSSFSDDNLVDVVRRTLVEQRDRQWINNVKSGRGHMGEQAAFVRLGAAIGQLRSRPGFESLRDKLVANFVDQGASRADAEEIIDARLEGMRQEARPRLSPPAPPEPASSAPLPKAVPAGPVPVETAAPLRPEPGDVAEGERLVRTPAGASIRTRMEVVDASTLTQAAGANDDIRSITGSLADVAAPWAKLRQSAKAGEVDAGFDITDDLADAAARVSDARKRGIKPRDILAQQDAFDQISPIAAELVRAFHNKDMTRSASRKAVSSFLADYIKAANAEKAGDGLFGEQPERSPEAILKELLEARDNPNGAGLALEPKETSNGKAPEQGDGGPARRDGQSDRDNEAEASGRDGLRPAQEDDAGGQRKRVSDVRQNRGSSDEIVEDRPAYAPEFNEASYTNRQSVYTSAVEAIGLDYEQFNILPPARKIVLLSRALEKLTGVEVTVAPGMPKQFAIDQLLDAHQTLQGMAYVLGIDPKGLSLKGRLKLELVGKARFLGAYQPVGSKIILPQRSNSFGHEWAHALDYYLLDRLSPSQAAGLTGEIRHDGAQPENVQQAFVTLLNAMFFDGAALAHKIMVLQQRIQTTKSAGQKAAYQTQIDNILSGRSQAKEKSRYWRGADAMNKAAGQGDYWTKPTEMFARAFEAWTAFKMSNEAFGTEFVNKGNAGYLSDAEERFAKTFPKGEERVRIFAAMQGVMDTINSEAVLEAMGPGQMPPLAPKVQAAVALAARKQKGLVRKIFGPDLDAMDIKIANRREAAADAARRPANPVKLGAKFNNVRALAFSAASDGVKIIAQRWNSKAAQAIHDHFSMDLGGTRRVDRVWDEAITIRERKALNPIFNLLQGIGGSGWVYKTLTAPQRDTLRTLLTLRDGQAAPADTMGLKPLASAMRNAYNNEWYANRDAGIALGYVRDAAYLNRQIDRELVAGDTSKFMEQAPKVYELVFDRDVGKSGAVIAADDVKLDAFLAIAKKAKIGNVKAIRKANPNDQPALIDAILPAVRDAYAIKAAGDYLDAILHTETFPDFTPTANLPDSEKPRALPAEADELLKDFYNPDPVSSLLHYVVNSVRRTEWAKRFGHDNAIGKKLDEQMAAEGVPESERRRVWALVERMSGRYKRTGWLADPGVVQVFGLLRVKGALSMLGRAVTLSTFEPAALSLVTGNVKFGLQAVARTWGNVLVKGSRDERMEWARAQGFIQHHMLEQVRATDRFNTTSDTPIAADKLLGWMFRNSGLAFLTSASDAAVADVGRRGILVEMAQRVAKGGSRGSEGENLMRELGIRDPQAFAAEIVAMNDAMPSEEWMTTPLGWDYTTALYRLQKMTIQKSDVADLAPLSRNPLSSYATYSITGYLQSAYRHLMKRNAKIILRLDAKGQNGLVGLALAGALSGWALLYSLNMISSVTRELLSNFDRQEEWWEEGIWAEKNAMLTFSRTFSFGVLDPVFDAWQGLRFNRSLAYVPLGAYAGADFDNATKVGKLFVDNSAKKNNSEHAAIQGLYSLAIAPSIAAGLASLPGGPLATFVAGTGTAGLTSPQAGKSLATAIVGERDGRKGSTATGFDKATGGKFAKKSDKEKDKEKPAADRYTY